MKKLIGIKIPNWPTATTICRVCGEPIIYFMYWDAEQTKRRRPPICHDGECKATWHEKKLQAKLKRYKKQREKSKNKLKFSDELPI